jgi:Sec-independent protein translocase protein TatA
MEILGIGPGEFILILIVLLVVVGPERLPGLARQAGGILVRARNWMQTSPDAALVLRARQEIEAELASIKASLMEVQVVRDEVLGAAKQLEDSVGSITSAKLDVNSLVKAPAEQTIAANGQVGPAGETANPAAIDGAETIAPPLDQRSTIDLPPGNSAPIAPAAEPQPANAHANGATDSSARSAPAAGAPAAPALAELESINIRLHAIMADMWALQQQLKQRGALDESWQPPSVDVQLPAHETAPLAGPVSAAAAIEDEAMPVAHKLLEQFTPIDASDHAPPSTATPAAGAAEADLASEAASSTELDSQPAAPARKSRKRRPPAAADAAAPAAAAPAIDTPAPSAEQPAPPAKARRRRAQAASAAPSDETEPVTIEKAS